MPWNDTAQLDFLNPEVREAVIQTILHVARRSSVIRFDAAMVLAKKHIQRLWHPTPGSGEGIASRAEFGLNRTEFNERMPVEFWREVVDRIAEEAGVAHGLIYLYFKNQQDLFDQLLPHVGEAMLRFIAQATLHARTLADRERDGLEANFAYLRQHPALHRILNEAAFFAPAAHQQYLRRMAGGYTRSLQRGWSAGEVDGYDESELEVLAYMIIGAREYLLERYAVSGSEINDLPDHVKKTYLRVVARSLGIDEERMMTGMPEAQQTG